MTQSMEISRNFLRLILDSISEHIVVIDETGKIQFVNERWSAFGENNACLVGGDWTGLNYLAECDKASSMGDSYGATAGDGIRSVLDQRVSKFYFEYPCHSPDEMRWFMMRVTPFGLEGRRFFVISHQNITERKVAEEEVRNLARLDGLTGISNRRTFDEFLHEEWRRCLRLKLPISLVIVDIDHFKILNDTYGHQTGDECLVKVAALLRIFAKRPSDICARYGGEEFALVWGNTPLEAARELTTQFLRGLVDLKIPNINSPSERFLTASAGLAEMIPTSESNEDALIARADRMLYKAKKNGRNTCES